MCSSLMIPAATFSIMKWTRIMKCLTFFVLPENAVASVMRLMLSTHSVVGCSQLWVSELGEDIPKEHDVLRSIESGVDFGFR